MDTVINKLSEIEVAASRILDSAANQKKLLDQQLEEQIASYDQQIDRQTADEIASLQKALSSSMDSELQKLKLSSEEALQNLERYYQEHHEALAAQIYENIIRK